MDFKMGTEGYDNNLLAARWQSRDQHQRDMSVALTNVRFLG